MSHNILILDDDADFNSLLTDIFKQADYNVTSMTDPEKAVVTFREQHFDLVVTDHRMPEMTGAEFMKLIKKYKPEVPVIMVSGYLENETIRELIRDGVGGVFLKPLNIFSLLERTSELIEETEQSDELTQSEQAAGEVEGAGSALGFSFRSYPGLSEASAAFAERISTIANFESTLSLIGEKGIHYRSICDDIRQLGESETEQFIYFSPGSLDEAQALSLINDAQGRGAERVTCVLLDSEKMNDAQKLIATQIAKRAAAFEGMKLRTIFCVNGDLDSLFDAGLIDENLYILMGTSEVTVPPLRKCEADIEVMAQQLVASAAQKKLLAEIPRIERAARDLLRKHDWPNNYKELSDVIERIFAGNPREYITHSDVRAALKTDPETSMRQAVEAHLFAERSDLLHATLILFQNDARKVADFFGTEVEAVNRLAN